MTEVNFSRPQRLVVVAAALVALIALALVTLARADGSPDIGATVSSSSTLYGNPVHVDVSADNPKGQPYGYNLTFRVVLPEGVGYAGGAAVAPKQLSDAPNPGETTLIFENVSDLSPGSTRSIGFDLEYSQSVYDAGDDFPVIAQAFVNEDARFLPKFDTEGIPDSSSYTGNTPEVTGIQSLKAVNVEIEEGSREGEIIRGVHEHQTVYTLRVTNNGINPTTNTQLDAYVPAGLEFLGCGGPNVDNTTDSPTTGTPEEWPESGPIVVEPLAGCVAPDSVETETVDPDGVGPMPEAVYTHVVFPVGELKDGETKLFPYRAAVPLRANQEFSGAKPSAASGGQATNLDNNSGPEVVDESPIDTYAKVSGLYQGTTPKPVDDEEVNHRTAEDWVVYKEASTGTLAQGQVTTWTLTFRTSEYKFIEGATVIDTLPSGLCPLGPTNLAPSDPEGECDPTGDQPSVPYTAAGENADGTWSIEWGPTALAQLAHSGISDQFQISFPSKTRRSYQKDGAPNGPILTHDRVDNTVFTEGTERARCTSGGAPACEPAGAKIFGADGPTITDASHAEQVAGAATIDKKVAVSGTDCGTATYAETVPHYEPGDVICWKLRVQFPSALDTEPLKLSDFLPENTEYVAGSDTPTGENDVTSTLDASAAGEGLLQWEVTGSTVPAGGEVFEHTLKTKVKPVGTPLDGDLVGNLFKFASENTGEESFPQRDEAEFVLDTPVLSLVKGVNTVNGQPPGGNPPNTDGVEVHEGDFVEYEIEVTNEGSAAAYNVAVTDLLEDGIECEDVNFVSHAGGCVFPNGTAVDWFFEGPIAPGATETFSYGVAVPSGVNPDKRIDDHAGVVSYANQTNYESPPETPFEPQYFTYHPANNIGGAGPVNAPAADDTSWVHTPASSFAKTAVTGVDESGNNVGGQATIGELITYTAKFTQPAGTTIGAVEFSDHLEPGRYEFITASVTLNGGSLPGPTSVALDPAGGIEASAGSHTNPTGSGDDFWELTMVARVADVAANSRVSPKNTLTNTAHFDWFDEAGVKHPETASVSTQIVEPNITTSKSDDDGDNRVVPGQVLTYTVGATNANGTRVSMAHEVTIADEVPEGLIPVGPAPGNVPLADGEEVPGSGGAVWDEGTRTIRKEVGDLNPSAGASFSYRTEVESPATAG